MLVLVLSDKNSQFKKAFLLTPPVTKCLLTPQPVSLIFIDVSHNFLLKNRKTSIDHSVTPVRPPSNELTAHERIPRTLGKRKTASRC